MSSDDPYGGGGGSDDDWGNPPQPQQNQDNIDMNYGQPLPPQGAPPQQQHPGAPQQQFQQGGPVQGPTGGPLQPSKPKLENDDLIAIVVNLFFPGVGQMMLGQTVKGIVILVVSVFTCGGAGLLYIAVIIDAYLVAMTRKYRQLGDWEFFPDINKHLGSG